MNSKWVGGYNTQKTSPFILLVLFSCFIDHLSLLPIWGAYTYRSHRMSVEPPGSCVICVILGVDHQTQTPPQCLLLHTVMPFALFGPSSQHVYNIGESAAWIGTLVLLDVLRCSVCGFSRTLLSPPVMPHFHSNSAGM